MKNTILVLFLIALLCPSFAELQITLTPTKKYFAANETVVIKVDVGNREEDMAWDTYLMYRDSRNTPFYITPDGTSLEPKVLGMLPPEIELKPAYWHQPERVQLFVCLCLPNTEKVIGMGRTFFEVGPAEPEKRPLPVAHQLLLVQEVANDTTRYTDYKQFDSSWKNTTMGQSNGTTIGASGCAITSVGNIRGITPPTINSELKSDGGYSGNYIIWSKVRGLSYKGSDEISDSLFSSYHVIADVGGHFVLLTGVQSTGKYYSKDPGKSSNPVYSSSQIYSVRLYYR